MLRAKDGFIMQKMMNNYMIIAIGENARDYHSIIQTNGTGAFYWQMIEKGTTPEEIVRAALERYEGLDEATAKQDVHEFLESISPVIEMIP